MDVESKEGESLAPTRTAVLLVHAESYRQRTGLSHEKWCEAVDREYCRAVPESQRSLSAPDLASQTDADRWVKLRRSWDQTVRRLTSGEVRFPADLEEAWVAAMGEPWQTRCKRELAWRHGLWGAVRHGEGAKGDHSAWGRALSDFGDLTKRVGDVLADGVIDGDDLDQLPDLIEISRSMQADLASLQQRALAVLREHGRAGPGTSHDQSA